MPARARAGGLGPWTLVSGPGPLALGLVPWPPVRVAGTGGTRCLAPWSEGEQSTTTESLAVASHSRF